MSRLSGPQRVTLFLILGVLALVGIFLSLFEPVEEEIEIGLSGEARINDYLAAERLFLELGVSADSVWGLEEMPEQGVLLLLDNDPGFRERIAEDVLAWVHDGGLAVVGTTTLGPHPILDLAGFVVPEGPLDTGSPDTLPDLSLLSDVTLPHGAGAIVMLPEPARYGNDRLGEPEHAAALWQAVSEDGPPTQAVLVVRGSSPSLLGSLWGSAWPAILSLLVLIAGLITRAGRRLGPLLPDPDPHRRSLVEHIDATGVFLWRQGHSAVLLDSARKAAGQPPGAKPITDPRQFTAEIQQLQQEWKFADP